LWPSRVIRSAILSAVFFAYENTLSHLRKKKKQRAWTAHLAEDDTLPNRQKVVQSDQRIVLGILVLTVEVELGDGVHGYLVPLQLNLVCTRGEVVDMGLHLVTKCGRKQHQLTVGR
jgi:hypothetical protein